MASAPSWLWRSALALAALFWFAGGSLHPNPVTSRSFEQSTAEMLADPRWGASHGLMLIGYLLLIPGFLGLAANADTSAARRAARFAVAGAALSAIEMVFHLSSTSDLESLKSGGPTLILHTHLVLSTLAQPLLGFAVAATALLTARSAGLAQTVVSVVGIVGGLAHGLAAPVVVATRDQNFSMLFKLGVLMVPWLLWTAATAGRALCRVMRQAAVVGG